MGDERGSLMFAMLSPDGTWSAPREASAIELHCDDTEASSDTMVGVYRRPWQQEWHGELRIENPELVRDLLGDRQLGTAQTLVVDHHRQVWRHRHRYVGQYRRERKGNRANRKVRGRWETVRMRSVIPRAHVTGIDQEFSADVKPGAVTVEFEVGQCG